MQTIPSADKDALASIISVGDKVEITRHDGNVQTFVVDQLSESSIGGEGHVIDFDDIKQVRIAQSTGISRDQKAIWIALGIAVAVIVLGNGPQEIQGF